MCLAIPQWRYKSKWYFDLDKKLKKRDLLTSGERGNNGWWKSGSDGPWSVARPDKRADTDPRSLPSPGIWSLTSGSFAPSLAKQPLAVDFGIISSNFLRYSQLLWSIALRKPLFYIKCKSGIIEWSGKDLPFDEDLSCCLETGSYCLLPMNKIHHSHDDKKHFICSDNHLSFAIVIWSVKKVSFSTLYFYQMYFFKFLLYMINLLSATLFK